MAAFFERVLQISLSGSVIVLAVLALRLVLKNAPKRAVCLLWMIAVLRLLVPFEIQSDWSMQPPPPEFAPPQVQQEDYFDSGTVQSPVPPEFLENAVEYPLVQPAVPEKVTLSDVLPWLWLLGVILLSVHGAVSFIRLKRRVRDAVILEEGVWLCPGLDTAFVLGFIRPQIYLPVLEQEERELVLLHERCHIRRGDHWWKLLAYAAVSIHWFNPLAWVTYILMCRDMELACDQETVKSMDNAKRKAYSAALLNCAARRSGIAACPVAFGEISVKERIKMVLHYRKPGFWVTLIALIAAMAVGVFLLTSPRELTDLERCEQGLKQWQGMESIHLHEAGAYTGDYSLNETSVIDYWASGENALERVVIDEDAYNEHWRALWDGIMFSRAVCVYDGEREDTAWTEDTVSAQWSLPWVLALDWDMWEMTHIKTENTESGVDIHLEAYRPEKGIYTMVFSFTGEELVRITRTTTDAVLEDRERDGILATVSTVTSTLVETDRKDIEKQMKLNGPVPELVCLYRELDALQAAECVHLVMDTAKDNAHGGWDNRHREFVKWGNNWYWDADMLSDYGTIENSYLWYGQKMYHWAHANADGAPQHPWQESEERYDVPDLLTKDWRALPVLEIRQEDGYTVVRLDGEPTDTERMTYYSLTYDFYLDRDGRLTKRVADFHVREFVKEVGYVETRATGTMTFPDTPDSEIQTRITEVWNNVKNDIRTIDIPAELSQLYSELKALQNAENVHLVIDMELDSDYPGWETCRQEFIRADDRFYRNFDYRSPAGPFTTTYLRYGQAVYAREYSDAGVVANRDWEHIQDRGFGELALLNQDWTRFQVLDITKQADGSAVITMQGSLDPTDGVTYHEKIYEFHLDPNGRLTTQIVRANYTSEISDGFAQGTFEFEATDTVHILNTPCEELTKRILEVTMEVLDYRGKAQKSGN